MKIKTKLHSAFAVIACMVGVVGALGFMLSEQVYGLRTVEVPMEQNLGEVEVSIWEAIHAADSFRHTGMAHYEQAYARHIDMVESHYADYRALTDTTEERAYMDEFDMLWNEARTVGYEMIELTKKQKIAEDRFFVNVDEADDVLDFELQSKWSADDPNLLAKEQAVREVEVSVWEAIHAGQQFTGLAARIVRGQQSNLRVEDVAGAAAKASLVKGDFEKLMECQFKDVEEFWGKYKAMPLADFELAAVKRFDNFWAKAVVAGRDVVSLNKQSREHFDVLYEKVSAIDGIIDNKMQKFIARRIEQQDNRAQITKYAALAITVFAFVTSILLGLAITRSIARPIRQLRDATVKIGQGRWDVRVGTGAKGEFGDLAKSFNTMAGSLKRSTDILSSQNNQLRANEEELRKNREELLAGEQELREQQAELTRYVEELEKFNRLVVDREHKMIELKEEVATLKHRLGESLS